MRQVPSSYQTSKIFMSHLEPDYTGYGDTEPVEDYMAQRVIPDSPVTPPPLKRSRTVSPTLTDDEPPRKKRRLDQSSQGWFLTWNNYPEDWENHIMVLDGLKKWCYQPEVSSTGTPHIQGVLWFSERKKWSWINGQICAYWKPVRTLAAAVKYCSKKASKAGETRVQGFAMQQVAVRDPLKGKDLYAYQKEIIDMIVGSPDERSIYWYWSTKGNIGKSSLCKHLCLVHGAVVLGGRLADSLYVVAGMVNKGNPPKVVVFDIPRSQGGNLEYQILEKVKDGCFLSTKYESVMCLTNPPHVIVFANQAPVLGLLSEDRWKVKRLDFEPDLPGSILNYVQY